MPILRTCAPFVAGIGRMPYARFQAYNIVGGSAWVLLMTWAGFFFGNIPFVKENFGLVTIGIIVVSLIPVAWVALEEVSTAYRSFAHRVDIGAPVERVWRAFTDSRVLARWTTAGATVTPREKGRLHVMFGSDMECDAHIDVLVTAQRLRLILLPTRGMPTSDAVIVEDFLFERTAARHGGAFAEQRSSFGSRLGDVLSRQAPPLGAGAGPAQGVS